MTGAESESLLELSARQVDVYTQCCCPSSAAARSQTQMPAQSTPPAFGSQPSPSTSSQCEPCARNQLRAVASSGVACARHVPHLGAALRVGADDAALSRWRDRAVERRHAVRAALAAAAIRDVSVAS